MVRKISKDKINSEKKTKKKVVKQKKNVQSLK